ncbi:hypothetical protein [Sediminivirga luteola]|nr:hypothetical protein [Sediminivirga luteola]
MNATTATTMAALGAAAALLSVVLIAGPDWIPGGDLVQNAYLATAFLVVPLISVILLTLAVLRAGLPAVTRRWLLLILAVFGAGVIVLQLAGVLLETWLGPENDTVLTVLVTGLLGSFFYPLPACLVTVIVSVRSRTPGS